MEADGTAPAVPELRSVAAMEATSVAVKRPRSGHLAESFLDIVGFMRVVSIGIDVGDGGKGQATSAYCASRDFATGELLQVAVLDTNFHGKSAETSQAVSAATSSGSNVCRGGLQSNTKLFHDVQRHLSQMGFVDFGYDPKSSNTLFLRVLSPQRSVLLTHEPPLVCALLRRERAEWPISRFPARPLLCPAHRQGVSGQHRCPAELLA